MTPLRHTDARAALDGVFRAEHGTIVGGLVRRFGDVDLAEDAVGEAYSAAMQHWPAAGVPPNPAGWLALTARRKALDRVRRESMRPRREEEGMRMAASDELPLGVVDDDRLRLFFMCCHPSLGPDVRVALTLRLVTGLTVPEIAAAFILEERTMAQRITRAKRKIKDAGIPFRIPLAEDIDARLDGVLNAIFLTYNEGYLSHGRHAALRDELCLEAVRLARQVRAMVPGRPEPAGLLALLLLTQARRAARVCAGGLVLFGEQDRSQWDDRLIAEGLSVTGRLLADWTSSRPAGRFQLMATIAATHAAAPTAGSVDHETVRALYDRLIEVDPTPVVTLNRALAGAPLIGAASALEEVDSAALDRYHPWHVARAHLLELLGRHDEARAAIRAALELATNPLERDFLHRRLAELAGKY